MKTDQITPIDIINLHSIYQQWQALDNPKDKLARISAILPFVSLAGLLLIKYPEDQILKEIRQDFKKYYEENHPKKLEWQSSDFDKELISTYIV